MNASSRTGILVLSHGSTRPETNRGFVALVDRVAARLGNQDVLPAFFSLASPTIADQVAVLVARGHKRIVLMPYFLYSGMHVTHDIPELLDACRQQHPGVELTLLPSLEDDPAVEEVVADRLLPYCDGLFQQPAEGPAIEQRSYEIIDRQISHLPSEDPAARHILRRVIHATADFSYSRTLRVHADAPRRGLEALAAGAPIICDVRMLQAGMTKTANEVLCLIDCPDAAEMAKQQGTTRAAAAMQLLAPRLDGAIVAIGNAPTALWKVLEIAKHGGPRPALVVGLPVGLVGARESKLALADSDLCWITNTSFRGGSPVAAAVINALATLAKKA